MARKGFLPFLFFALITTIQSISFAQQHSSVVEVLSLNRSSFPTGFVFGTASAAYQVNASLILTAKPFTFHPNLTSFSSFFISSTYSTKVLQKKVEESQVYGMHSPTNIQVFFAVFHSLIISYKLCYSF